MLTITAVNTKPNASIPWHQDTLINPSVDYDTKQHISSWISAVPGVKSCTVSVTDTTSTEVLVVEYDPTDSTDPITIAVIEGQARWANGTGNIAASIGNYIKSHINNINYNNYLSNIAAHRNTHSYSSVYSYDNHQD
jgi:type III secretory pathway lipoprotein EscJ